jgi:ribonuclease VapC
VSEKVVLGSFALVSLYHREPGRQIVQRALYYQEKARTRAILNWINWGRIFLYRQAPCGLAKTTDALRLLEQLPIDLFTVDQTFVRAAAEIKSEHALSYADAFCVTAAQLLDATVVTGHPEFKSVERLIKIRWLTK